MGKTKITVIDDSATAEEEKKQKPKKEAKVNMPEADVSETETQVQGEDGSEQKEEEKNTDTQKKAKKPGKRTKIRSKKYKESLEKVDRTKNYPLEEAINLAKETSYSKFDGSLEIHLGINVKSLRGLANLPFASGKKLTILAFGKDAKESGADIAGDDQTIEEISKGKVNFDVLITSPEWMPKLARVAKYLGPRGLMPNPKNGTISDNLKKAVAEVQTGKTEYKTEKSAPIIHLGIGKISQPAEELASNTKALVNAIGKTKVKKITLSPTLGPGIKIDVATAS